MWQAETPPANLDYSITAGGELYGFMEQESSFTGESVTVGVWRSGIVFGPIRATAAECATVATIPILIAIALTVFAVLMRRSQRLAARDI